MPGDVSRSANRPPVVGGRREREVVPPPAVRRTPSPRPSRSAVPAVAGSQRHRDVRPASRPAATGTPRTACRRRTRSPAVQPAVLDAGLAGPAGERHPLALHADERRVLRHVGPQRRRCRSSSAATSPLTARARRRPRRTAARPAAPPALDPQVAILRGRRHCRRPTVPAGSGRGSVTVGSDLAVDRHLDPCRRSASTDSATQRSVGTAHGTSLQRAGSRAGGGRRRPPCGRRRARPRTRRSCRPRRRAWPTRTISPAFRTPPPGVAGGQEDVHAGRRRRRTARPSVLTSFGPSPAVAVQLARPSSRQSPPKAANPFGRRPRRRLLEALAEDHLAVQAAVDLVVHVLDARPGEVPADRPPRPAHVDADRRLCAGSCSPICHSRTPADQRGLKLRFEPQGGCLDRVEGDAVEGVEVGSVGGGLATGTQSPFAVR